MKKFSLKTAIEKIQSVALRFPFTLFFILGLAYLFLIQINRHTIDIKPNNWTFFSLGIGLSLSVSLFSEGMRPCWHVQPNDFASWCNWGRVFKQRGAVPESTYRITTRGKAVL